MLYICVCFLYKKNKQTGFNIVFLQEQTTAKEFQQQMRTDNPTRMPRVKQNKRI